MARLASVIDRSAEIKQRNWVFGVNRGQRLQPRILKASSKSDEGHVVSVDFLLNLIRIKLAGRCCRLVLGAHAATLHDQQVGRFDQGDGVATNFEPLFVRTRLPLFQARASTNARHGRPDEVRGWVDL